MIVKRPDGYHVISHTTGKNLGGPYATEEQAKHRLAQMRAFKYMHKHASFVSFIKAHPVGTGVSVLGGAVLGAGLAKRKEIKEEVGENVRNLT